MTVEDQRVDNDRLGETDGQCLRVFYADDGMMGSQDADCMQHSMNILVRLFQRYGLAANVAKSRTMMCQPSTLQSRMSDESMALKFTGVGNLYRVRL